VDDILIVHRDAKTAKELKDKLKKKYRMTDLGKAKRFLGMEIGYEPDGTITLSQSTYIDTIRGGLLWVRSVPKDMFRRLVWPVVVIHGCTVVE
jgi:hypothetical protein